MTVDIPKLEQILRELFVDNYKYTGGEYISPLSDEKILRRFDNQAQKKKTNEKELYDSLVQVVEAMEREHGISEKTYETHKYAINSLARNLTNSHRWGNPFGDPSMYWDREAKRATPEQVARFPEGKYGETVYHSHVNLFDEDYKKSNFEGTLFHLEYDDNSNLTSLKLFHQRHRNALSVATVPISKLMKGLEDFVSTYTDSVPHPLGFTLGKEAYLHKIEEFNAAFGQKVSVKVLTYEQHISIAVLFKENPQDLAQKLVCYGVNQGIGFRRNHLTPTIHSKDYHLIDLFTETQLQNPRQAQPFDPEKDKEANTVILPVSSPEFSISLMKMYLLGEEIPK